MKLSNEMRYKAIPFIFDLIVKEELIRFQRSDLSELTVEAFLEDISVDEKLGEEINDRTYQMVFNANVLKEYPYSSTNQFHEDVQNGVFDEWIISYYE